MVSSYKRYTTRFNIRSSVIYYIINDLVEYCNSGSEICLFADDAKIFSYVTQNKNNKQLQQHLNKFKEWMDTWFLSLNVDKCRSVSYGRRLEFSNTYTISDNVIAKVDKIKRLRCYIWFQTEFDEHIDIKISKAYQMLGIIKRNFISLTPDSFVVLYKYLVRSHLEYAVCVWNPHHQALIEKIRKSPKKS